MNNLCKLFLVADLLKVTFEEVRLADYILFLFRTSKTLMKIAHAMNNDQGQMQAYADEAYIMI